MTFWILRKKYWEKMNFSNVIFIVWTITKKFIKWQYHFIKAGKPTLGEVEHKAIKGNRQFFTLFYMLTLKQDFQVTLLFSFPSFLGSELYKQCRSSLYTLQMPRLQPQWFWFSDLGQAGSRDLPFLNISQLETTG